MRYARLLLAAVAVALAAAPSAAAADLPPASLCREVRGPAGGEPVLAEELSQPGTLVMGIRYSPQQAGARVNYPGIKLRDSEGKHWAVIYEEGDLYKLPADALAYCDPPGCESAAGSNLNTEEGASCEQDSECCDGLSCVDRTGTSVALTQAHGSTITLTTSDPSPLLPKQCRQTVGGALDSVTGLLGDDPGDSSSDPASGDAGGTTSGDASGDASGGDLLGGLLDDLLDDSTTAGDASGGASGGSSGGTSTTSGGSAGAGTSATSLGDLAFLEKCGTPAWDAAAADGEMQRYFELTQTTAACGAAAFDWGAICPCYSGLGLSCPACFKAQLEASLSLDCRKALVASTYKAPDDALSEGSYAELLFDMCGLSYS